jgi:amino acid permease
MQYGAIQQSATGRASAFAVSAATWAQKNNAMYYLSLGTGKTWVAYVVIIVLVMLVVYVFYWIFSHPDRKRILINLFVTLLIMLVFYLIHMGVLAYF